MMDMYISTVFILVWVYLMVSAQDLKALSTNCCVHGW